MITFISVAAATPSPLGTRHSTLAAALRLEQQPPTFRSGAQVVEVDVRVFDREGRFVGDLTRDDFELLEDGEPQRVEMVFLAGERGTVTLPAGAGRESVTVPLSPLSPRQTWIFFFDLNHLTPGAGFERAREAVATYIRERFRDGDLAGVVAGARMVNNRLTSVREVLVSVVSSLKPLPDARNLQLELTREWPRLQGAIEAIQIANEDREAIGRAVTRACTEDPDACARVPPDAQVREKARRLQRVMQRTTMDTLAALNALGAGLAKMAGPKTIVFLTDGFVAQELETTLRNVVGQIARAGARVYAVDVRGLTRGRGGAIIDQPLADDGAGGPAQFDAQEDGANSLGVDTGGMLIRNENNIGRALDGIAQDANRYYVLAYRPANANFDGKFRSIAVHVRRDDVRVRARRGYLALEPSRMLVPEPIASSRKEDAPRVGHETVTPAPSPDNAPAAATAKGSIVATPAAPAPLTPRLRPDAADQIRALAGSDTESASAAAGKGWEAYQRGDVEAALPLFTEAAAQERPRPWVLYALGLSQVALGLQRNAIASWERVRQAAPEFDAVYLDLADAYVQLSEISKALAVLRAAEKRWPANADVHNAIGVIHVRRGALDEAIEAFTRAVGAAPGEPLGHLNLGRAYERRYVRGRRYVTSQRRWVAPDEDRRNAREAYQRCIKLGGPYASQAAEALSRLEWIKGS